MAWKLTKDLLNPFCLDPTSEIDNSDGAKQRWSEAVGQQEVFTFRLKDDDDEVYFEGLSTDNNSEEAFAPLDWAMPNYGCTSIEYKNANGEWEVL